MAETISGIMFYLFSGFLLLSAIGVILAKQPVHSVLCLIAAFFNAAGLFVLMGAEFIAFIVMIVYVGAVAVLFLFVVMMLDVNFKKLRQGFTSHMPLCLAIAGLLLVELVMVGALWSTAPGLNIASFSADAPENTRALGQVLYTDYFIPFIGSGFVLLVAMIGAIVLTLRDRKGMRRQKLADQLDAHPEDVVKIHKVASGEGI